MGHSFLSDAWFDEATRIADEISPPVPDVLKDLVINFRIQGGPAGDVEARMAAGRLEGNKLHADIDGYRQRVVVVPHDGRFTLFSPRGALEFALAQPDYGEEAAGVSAGAFTAPMPGVIVRLMVAPGEAVTRGQPLLIMEAMKMEHRICAPAAGTVGAFCFGAGDSVDGGEELLQFEPAESVRE